MTSGILEAYLLGLVAETEREELEHVLATDPEVLAQLTELEATMEDYFISNAVPPPPGIREKIELRISETEVKKWQEADQPRSKQQAKQPEPAPAESPYIQVEVSDTHIRVHKYWRAAFIAVFVLSKVFLILGLYYYFKSNSLQEEIQRLKSASQQTTTNSRRP
ncbi:hypothetical protein [Spirosoma koreense]